MKAIETPAPEATNAGAGAPLLETRGLGAGYGPVSVIRSLDLSVGAGQVLAILGPNGAGKTTLMLTLAGLLPRQGGEMLLDGRPLPANRPAAINRAGLVLVPDDRALFSGQTVRQNIEIAADRKAGMGFDEVADLFPSLRDRGNQKAGSLSGGEQQMLAVARGLVQDPRVLLIDEMSMGLAPVIVESLLPIVRRIADETGAGVVLVEQHVQLALEVADSAVVLVHGAVALRGSARELAADPAALEAAYIGGHTPDHPAAGPPADAAPRESRNAP